ncbi:hypothetical protein RP20_CCG009913 [Aedes albopictus]|nr:hypothetical protein RP20_CCG009913 [Aedes albopictus]
MFGRVLRDKLPSLPGIGLKSTEEAQDKDRERKLKQGEYADKRRRAEPNMLEEGDVVVAKRSIRENKLASNFGPEEFVIVDRKGSEAMLRSTESGKTMNRNVSHLKPILRNCKEGTADKLQNSPVEEGCEKSSVEQIRPRREVRRPSYLQDFDLARVHDY